MPVGNQAGKAVRRNDGRRGAKAAEAAEEVVAAQVVKGQAKLEGFRQEGVRLFCWVLLVRKQHIEIVLRKCVRHAKRIYWYELA